MIPLVATALLIAVLVTGIAGRFVHRMPVRAAILIVTLGLLLAPLGPLPAAQYLQALTGDLSVVTMGLLLLWARDRVRGQSPSEALQGQLIRLSLLIVFAAALLYPTALGATPFDVYAYGYYPVVLAPLLLVIFIVGVWQGWYLLAALLGLAFTAYVAGLLASDNLWDYVIDPVLTVYAIGCLIRHRHRLANHLPRGPGLQHALVTFGAVYLLFGALLAQLNRHGFSHHLAVENGFIDTATVLILGAIVALCVGRMVALRRRRSPLLLLVTTLIAILCVVLGIREIWTLIGTETPRYLAETVILGLLIGITPLYRLQPASRAWLDKAGVPLPTFAQIGGYIFVALVTELFIDTGFGQMAQFGYTIVFYWQVAFPYNQDVFMTEFGDIPIVTSRKLRLRPRST